MTLRRKTPLRRTTWLRRPGWAHARQSRLDLALHWCEAMVPGVCAGEAVHVPPSDEAHNLLALCAACHRWVHDHPAESYAHGWLIRSGGNNA